jgi:hypothetical protein
LVVGLLLAAGGLSAFGLLRWQTPPARWSFSFLCWGMAVIVTQNRSAGHDPRR